MTGPIRGAGVGAAAAPPQSEAERLRGVARDMEGVFVEQLFKAMRETVPEGGLMDGGSGEEMFTGMLDQHLAAQTPARWEHGLAEALYRQLRGVAGLAPDPAAAPSAPVHSSPRAHGPILGAR